MVETAIGTHAFQDVEVPSTKCAQVLATSLHRSPCHRVTGQFFPTPETPFLQAGPPFSPPGGVMGVSGEHQTLGLVAPQYVGSQPLPKEVSAQAGG